MKYLEITILIYNILYIKSSTQNESSANLNRIIGGTIANKKDWPFIVAITTGQVVHCGGSLIKKSWILTAGHCVDEKDMKTEIQLLGSYGVRLGSGDLMYKNILDVVINKTNHFVPQMVATVGDIKIIHKIKKIILHPKYLTMIKSKSSFGAHDIALIQLVKPVFLSDKIKLVKLPRKSIKDVYNCRAAGWGSHKLGSTFLPLSVEKKNLLYELVIFIVKSKKRCDGLINMYASGVENKFHKLLTLNKICALSIDTTEGMYKGDSGGPLICDGKLHGVASMVTSVTTGRGDVSLINIYTKVPSYITWINKVFKENGEEPLDLEKSLSSSFSAFITSKFWTVCYLICFISSTI